jgi:hypothetical protein
LKMSTTKPFSQWTVIALREFLKERGVRSSGLKAQLVYRGRQCNVPFFMRKQPTLPSNGQ